MAVTRLTRRRFIASAAATVCVGCSSEGAGGGVQAVGADQLVSVPDTVGPSGAVEVGVIDDVVAAATESGATYVPEARAWLVPFPLDALDAARSVYPDELHAGLEAGLIALYQQCPHLGCRVPYCESSGWFECPCHASRFGSTGEHRGGPSPRGMDAFPIRVDDGVVTIETNRVISGLGDDVVVVDTEASGPHCVDESEH